MHQCEDDEIGSRDDGLAAAVPGDSRSAGGSDAGGSDAKGFTVCPRNILLRVVEIIWLSGSGSGSGCSAVSVSGSGRVKGGAFCFFLLGVY